MRARDHPSRPPMKAMKPQPPRNTSHMATGMNHRCASICTLGMSCAMSAGRAMLMTHQLSRGARSGGGFAKTLDEPAQHQASEQQDEGVDFQVSAIP